jgi:cobalamin biosynthesis protein CobD/CbiB
MATLAAALGVQLEKLGHYTLNSVAALPMTAQGHHGVALVGRAGWLTALVTAVIVGV